MLIKEQIEYALHYAEDPVEWVFELVRGLEKRIDELLKFGTKVTVFQEHWHPASELPPVDENGNSPALIAITSDGFLMRVYFNQESNEYSYGVNVEWWCYPPKED